jgi:hypothetical protein
MVYSVWLFAHPASFIIAERLWPDKRRALERLGFPGIDTYPRAIAGECLRRFGGGQPHDKTY